MPGPTGSAVPPQYQVKTTDLHRKSIDSSKHIEESAFNPNRAQVVPSPGHRAFSFNAFKDQVVNWFGKLAKVFMTSQGYDASQARHKVISGVKEDIKKLQAYAMEDIFNIPTKSFIAEKKQFLEKVNGLVEEKLQPLVDEIREEEDLGKIENLKGELKAQYNEFLDAFASVMVDTNVDIQTRPEAIIERLAGKTVGAKLMSGGNINLLQLKREVRKDIQSKMTPEDLNKFISERKSQLEKDRESNIQNSKRNLIVKSNFFTADDAIYFQTSS